MPLIARATPLIQWAVPPAPDSGKPVAVFLIPAYREQARIAATLSSLANQGCPTWAVVVDDGSPEPLVVSESPVPTLLIRLPTNTGIEGALNAGTQVIAENGIPWIARLDCGDRAYPGRLAKQLAAVRGDTTIVATGVRWITTDGTEVQRRIPPPSHRVHRAFALQCPLIHPTVLLRTGTAIEVGGYPTTYPACEDYAFLWRVARRGGVVTLAEVLVDTAYDPQGISLTRHRRQLKSRLRVQWDHAEWAQWQSWLGLARTVLQLAMPQALVQWIG
jgi:glycosyltransferase involved in cell wall biosynthesis